MSNKASLYSKWMKGYGIRGLPISKSPEDDFDRCMRDKDAIRQEAELIKQKKSRFSANQRRAVMNRYEELNLANS